MPMSMTVASRLWMTAVRRLARSEPMNIHFLRLWKCSHNRKNWLFCWSELGAEHVGVIQSLITTCKLHDINPYPYLTDVLLRVGDHPAKEVQDLTPRLWKEYFAGNPRQSDLYMACNHSVE